MSMQPVGPEVVRIFILLTLRLYRDGLERALAREDALRVIGSSTLTVEAWDAIAESSADVALVDLSVSEALGGMRALHDKAPHVKLIGLAATEVPSEVIAWLEAGMTAYVTYQASLDDLVATILRTMRGEVLFPTRVTAQLFEHLAAGDSDRRLSMHPPSLTLRERQVACLVAQGFSNKEIARQLSIALPTVKSHVHSVLHKLCARRRLDVVARLRHVTDIPARGPDPRI